MIAETGLEGRDRILRNKKSTHGWLILVQRNFLETFSIWDLPSRNIQTKLVRWKSLITSQLTQYTPITPNTPDSRIIWKEITSQWQCWNGYYCSPGRVIYSWYCRRTILTTIIAVRLKAYQKFLPLMPFRNIKFDLFFFNSTAIVFRRQKILKNDRIGNHVII